MSTQSYKSKDAYSNSTGLPDKMAVVQECLQQFNSSPVNARKCRKLLAKLLRLIYNGELFPSKESTTLFFSISKLFQHKDQSLRQLVYLTIKELSATSDDILMVTSSIMKDIQGGNAIYKPNAIRTLSRVLDPTTVNAAERLFKNAIVDKNPVISSAALVSSYNLYPIAKDVVKRFTTETLEAIQAHKQFPSNQYETHDHYGGLNSDLPSTSYMYQYHALGLLYHLRNHDRMALVKLITTLSEGTTLKNSLAVIQLIKYINKILLDDESMFQHLFPILSNLLKHSSDMVELEACKTIVQLQHLIKEEQLQQVISTLQNLLTVPRVATRFAAIRLINKISVRSPEHILIVSVELESLINDSNRAIATLAITTLLKTMGAGAVDTGSEGGERVDRLISKMTSLMDEITEEFKIVIIEAIESLALKFPAKHKKLVTFLTDFLRDDGSLALKTSIVNALFGLIKFLPDAAAKQLILMNLCEFIEDCEFTELSVRILYLLGEEGPRTTNPSYYIRHIYNRLVLENSIIRSSAVISLSKFAIVCEGDVAANIKILLNRCLNDVDDEVRDRAVVALKFIAATESKATADSQKLIFNESKFDLAAFENKLTRYLNDQTNFEHKFDISEVPVYSGDELKTLEYSKKMKLLEKTSSKEDEGPVEGSKAETSSSAKLDDYANDLVKQQEYANELSTIEQFQAFGKLTKSVIQPVYLTDKENEIVVTVVKHLFVDTRKLVLQYNITNTLPSNILQDIKVNVEPDNELYSEDLDTEFILPELQPDTSGTVYVTKNIPDLSAGEELLAAFGNSISYINKDDEDDEGYPDEYQVDDLEVYVGDFVTPLFVNTTNGANNNFTAIYDLLPHYDSRVVPLQGISTITDAVQRVKKLLNMSALEGSEFVLNESVTSHQLKLYGRDVWGGKVGVLVSLALSGSRVVAKVEARSETENFSSFVAQGTY